MPRNSILLAVCALTLASICPIAGAATIFAQTPSPDTLTDGTLTTRANGEAYADPFTLQTAATARSVVWRGFYHPQSGAAFPLNFTLALYDSNNGLPNAVVGQSATPVTFEAISPLVVDTHKTIAGEKVYEFSASINATALAANTTYWLSVLGEPTAGGSNQFYWATDSSGAPSAYQKISTQQFFGSNVGLHYFSIGDTAIPEPTSLAMLAGAGALALIRRRRA